MNVYIPPIIEKVYNVQGSTAAPGSGEYHRYRALRRRERTIAAAMENEYKERQIQKEFDENKQKRAEKAEHETLKRKRRREKKEEKKKLKKMFNHAIANKNDIFKKDTPLIDQLKQEMSEEEFGKLLHQENKQSINDEYDYENLNKMNEQIITSNPQMKKIKRNVIKVEEVVQNPVVTEKENKGEIEKNLTKLFPSIEEKEYDFDYYDEYEEHLEIMDIKAKLEKLENQPKDSEIEKEQVKEIKYKEIDQNIIIHDDDF